MKIYLLSLYITLTSVFGLFANNAVVKVETTSEQGIKSHTSGFLINKTGHILTSYDANKQYISLSISVPYLTEPLSATIQAIYPELCTAVLKLTYASLQRVQTALGDIPYLELERDPITNKYLNQKVTALGYGLTDNRIQSRTGEITGYHSINNTNFITSTISTSPGFGGGPVVNKFNKVIGITQASTYGGFYQNTSNLLPIFTLLVELGTANKALLENAKELHTMLNNNGPSFWTALPKELQQEALRYFIGAYAINIPQPTA